MIGVINYEAGNAPSVLNALGKLAIQGDLVSTPDEIGAADKLILPGVGSARATLDSLEKMRCREAIEKRVLREGVPFLGICIGFQIIFEHSEEGDIECLGWIEGKVTRFPEQLVRVPHIGWNEVEFQREHPLFTGLGRTEHFYFVHSYYGTPEDETIILGETEYGVEFCSMLAQRNILATQFHVEKSGPVGLKLLKNFATIGRDELVC